MKYVETIKVVDGKICHFDYHQRRASATSGIVLPSLSIPNEFQEGVVKCRVVYDKEVSAIEFSHYTFPTIKSLQVVEASHYFYDRKYTDRSKINELFSMRGDCDDVLIAVNGYVTDTSYCNIVCISNEGLFTPKHPLLHGTKREFLIDKGVVRPRSITVEELPNYQEIKLINAFIDLDYPNATIQASNILLGGYSHPPR